MEEMILRDHLGKGKSKAHVDMEKAYRLIDSGMSIKDVAEKFGVSVSTLYRRHHEYQTQAKYLSGGPDMSGSKW